MGRWAVQVTLTDGDTDLSHPPRDIEDPQAWTQDRANTWERIGIPAQAINLDQDQEAQL